MMEQPIIITVYTQVYNTKPYIRQCIESVLNQTFPYFEYYVIDNGSTDGCKEILEKYAAADSRIKLIRHEKNSIPAEGAKTALEKGIGRYYAILDSDDWWEPNYLESLIGFLERNQLDLALCGTVNDFEESKTSQIMRKLDAPVVLSLQQFAQCYPRLWVFPSTLWASVMRLDLFKKVDLSDVFSKHIVYGTDTIHMLRYMALCSRIGIDDTALYHYRIHPKSVTYQYDPYRFDANICCCEEIQRFLEQHNAFDATKQQWLKLVHLASMVATLNLLKEARIPEEKRIAECTRIATHPLTTVALSNHCTEREQWFVLMRTIVFNALGSGKLPDTADLYATLKILSPCCCRAVQPGVLGLFVREAKLRGALQRDDWDELVCHLMELIVQKRFTKQYDLGQVLCGLIPPESPLAEVTDVRFFRKYATVCMLVFSGNHLGALSEMTDILMKEKVIYAGEEFLQLYLSLAAIENQVPAFLFGKLQLAWFYLRQNRRDNCLSLVNELTEMGLENEELENLRHSLE